MNASVDGAADEPRALHHLEMPRHRGQRHIERPSEIADRRGATRKASQNAAARAVAQCREYPIETILGGDTAAASGGWHHR